MACGTPPGSSTGAGRTALEVERRYADFRQGRFAEVPDISVAELRRQLRQERQLVLVDVREPREQAVSMLPGAIGLRQFEAALAADPQHFRDTLVVPYCTIGLRSGLVARELRQRGFQTRNLAGSVLAWAHAGLPFEQDGRATHRVHVYEQGWNLLPPGYTAVTGG